jgi:hypothetical protein
MQKSLLNAPGLLNTEMQLYNTQHNNIQVTYKDPVGTSQRKHNNNNTKQTGKNHRDIMMLEGSF